ncbi:MULTISPECIES: hypothetical protein [Ralstonia]|jgi:hypothetical protein|uniref:Uncharacterized protein n=1 Tax=Ralstonia flaminis TaxID=3058597 RepID=A0ABM9K178_9RALS|nr:MULTISPECIES: hypothetical protein [unclassified Ralstonia]CAJ0809270.1 hypothetical protein LMG18101_00537 [Ralstonia sp. LMG 18101]
MNLSLAEMARRLVELEARVPVALSQGLEAAAAAMEQAARAKAVESAAAAGITSAARVAALRDSIGHEVKALEASIGSNSDQAIVQELGSAQVPPHPFLGAVALEHADDVQKSVGDAVTAALMGRPIADART